VRSGERDRGAAAVELALVLPVLLLIVFGTIDFGRLLHARMTLTEAAREGARAVALGEGVDVAKARAVRAASSMTSKPLPTAADVQVTPCGAGADPGAATVTVQHTFHFVTPFGGLARLLGGAGPGDTVTMAATGVMTCTA
jgi:Flp pilus assembly protein TadG